MRLSIGSIIGILTLATVLIGGLTTILVTVEHRLTVVETELTYEHGDWKPHK